MRRLSSLIAVGLGALAAGLGIGAVLVPQGQLLGAEEDASDVVATVVPVSVTETVDPVAATIEVTMAPARQLASPRGGLVTTSRCVDGGTIRSGEVVATLDGTVVGALATGIPLWRDVAVGASGDDVAALTRELRRLGADINETSALGYSDAVTVRAFLNGRGFSLGRGGLGRGVVVLPADRIVWLPAREVVVSVCDALVGDVVGLGEPLVTLMSVAAALTVRPATQPALDGDRELRVGEAQVPVPADGMVTDPDIIATVMASAPGQEFLRGAMDAPINAEYVLAEPVDVIAIPPGALIEPGSPSPCVLVESGTGVPVIVVENSLGRVLVRPRDASSPAPAMVRVDLAGEARCPSSTPP